MNYYSPTRKDKDCFKKNTLKKIEDEAIMVNRIQKSEIIFEIKKQNKSSINSKQETYINTFSNKLKEFFYERIKGFFNFEENDFNQEKELYSK